MHFKKQTWIIHQACTKFDGNLPPFNLNFVSENLAGKFSDKKLIIVDLFHQKTFEKVVFLCDIINFAINLFLLWLSFDLSQLVDMLKKLFSQCILAKFLAMSKPSKLLWSCLVKSRKLFCVVFYGNNNLHMKWPIFPNYGFNADIQHKFCHKCHVWFIVLIYYQHLKLMSGMEVSIIRSKWDVSTWKHIWKMLNKFSSSALEVR